MKRLPCSTTNGFIFLPPAKKNYFFFSSPGICFFPFHEDHFERSESLLNKKQAEFLFTKTHT
jgi:hypothetical protein